MVFGKLRSTSHFCSLFVFTQVKEKVPYTGCGRCVRVSLGIGTVIFWVTWRIFIRAIYLLSFFLFYI